MSPRNSYWLTLGTLATTLFQIAGYYGDVAAGHFIARGQMAVVGIAVPLGIITVAGTLVAAVRTPGAGGRAAGVYRGQMFVNASAAAFILGMLAYLAAYPPTSWVFDTVLALAFPLGIMLMIPVPDADAPGVIAVLNAAAGFTACLAGYVGAQGGLVMVGVLVGGAGWFLAIVFRRTMTRSLLRAVFTAFGPGTPG